MQNNEIRKDSFRFEKQEITSPLQLGVYCIAVKLEYVVFLALGKTLPFSDMKSNNKLTNVRKQGLSVQT